MLPAANPRRGRRPRRPELPSGREVSPQVTIGARASLYLLLKKDIPCSLCLFVPALCYFSSKRKTLLLFLLTHSPPVAYGDSPLSEAAFFVESFPPQKAICFIRDVEGAVPYKNFLIYTCFFIVFTKLIKDAVPRLFPSQKQIAASHCFAISSFLRNPATLPYFFHSAG